MSLAALGLMTEIQGLASLAGWEPVGSRWEALRAAARGGPGLSPTDVRRLRAWARRWSSMPEELRSFYAEHSVDNEGVSSALYCVLEGRDVPPSSRGAVYRAWREEHGVEPWVHPFPRFSTLAL